MTAKKFMMIGIFVLVGVLLVVLVSAKHAWWHPWGEEVQEAPFDASVSLSNSAPTIANLFPVYDRNPDNSARGADDDGEVSPVAGENVFAVVEFVVDDPNHDFATTTADLPLAPTVLANFDSPTGAVEIGVRIAAPTSTSGVCGGGGVCRERDTDSGKFPTGTATCETAECGDETDSDALAHCNDGSDVSPYNSLNSNRQVFYRCHVEMQYFDERTVGAGGTRTDYWDIQLYIEDISGTAGTASSVDFDDSPGSFDTCSGDCDENLYVDVNQANGMDIDPLESLSFSGVATVNFDTVGNDGDGDGSDGTGLTFRNRGNSLISATELKPTDLDGNTLDDGTSVLEVQSMSVDLVVGTPEGTSGDGDITTAAGGTGACDGPNSAGDTGTAATELIGQGTFADIEGFSVGFDATGTDSSDLFFCIWANLGSTTLCPANGGDGNCLTGPQDSSYSSDDTCTGPCGDGVGELWDLVPTFT